MTNPQYFVIIIPFQTQLMPLFQRTCQSYIRLLGIAEIPHPQQSYVHLS